MSSIVSGLVDNKLLSRVRKGCYKLLETPAKDLEISNKTPVVEVLNVPTKEKVEFNDAPSAKISIYIKEVFTWDVPAQVKLDIIDILFGKRKI
jgi:hypothetical protein